MKPKHLIFAIILLIIPLAFAIHGGEIKPVLHLDKCSKLNVSVSGKLSISLGEYSFVNCTLAGSNFWNCTCHDNYDLLLSTKPNTINTYNITAKYVYQSNISSAEQFCNNITIKGAGDVAGIIKCLRADWKNNERKLVPNDCGLKVIGQGRNSKFMCSATKQAN